MWFFGNHTECESENVEIVNTTEEYQRKYLLDVEYDDVAFFHLNGHTLRSFLNMTETQ